jgi:DNA repair photolyase
MPEPQLKIFQAPKVALPLDQSITPASHFDVDQIILAKGSLDTKERELFTQRICEVYPNAKRIEQLDTPHNRIKLEAANSLERHQQGKRTLVFGVMGNSVRHSEEAGNTCPNYWHFSSTGFCFYDCKYCYLAGTPGVWFSPTVKVYVNIEDLLSRIDRQAATLQQQTSFYLGKLQDGLALDPLTAFTSVLIPFFANHPFARQILLTKSDAVDRLLDLEHKGRTTLSWSLNPAQVASRFEKNIPSVPARIAAMKKCAQKGYPIRAVLMPIVPVEGWQDIYGDFLRALLVDVPLERLTIGGICSYQNANALMKQKLGNANEISTKMQPRKSTSDGRQRYREALRVQMYSHLIATAKKTRPDLEIALCLEEKAIWQKLGIEKQMGRCNCVL